jgi:hypothetical protein
MGARSRGARRRHFGQQAAMTEDTACDGPRVDRRDQTEPSAAQWTLDVESKGPLHQSRPQPIRARPPRGIDRRQRRRRRPRRRVGTRVANRRGGG